MSETPVLIVGAGPTGLLLGIELARRGVAFRLIDRYAQPLGWDRATVVKPRSLEVLDGLGLAETFMERGRVVRQATFFLKGASVATIGFDGLDSRYQCVLSLPESETERILTEELLQLGGTVERDIELTGLEQSAGSVRARLRRVSTGEESVAEANWLVGTDGLHSAVREAVADPFEGHDNPLLWAVVDGCLDGWRHPTDAIGVQLERPAVNPIPLGDGRWRIYFRPEDAGPGALDRVAEGLAVLSPGASLGEHDAPRFFHTHSRVARKYRVGRVLLAGDAAHVCSPIQGHGMNVGMQDAHNLGWKLALVVQGHATDGLLDSYEPERRPIAQAIVASGDESEKRFGGKDSDIADAVRRIANVAGHHRAVVAESEIAHCYRLSPIVLDAGPEVHEGEEVTQVGCRVGDVEALAHRDGLSRLHELLRHPRHTLIVLAFDGDGGDAAGALDEAASVAERFRPHVASHVAVRTVASEAGLSAGLIHDRNGGLHRRLAGDRPCVCLIRPDGHLSFRGAGLTMDRLTTYLDGIFSRSGGE